MGADPEELEDDEPRTPMWLPLLGGGLLLLALLVVLATRSEENDQSASGDSAAVEAAVDPAQPNPVD